MTFALSCHEVLVAMKRMAYIPANAVGNSQLRSQEVCGQSVDIVISIQRHIEEKYLRHLNLTRPFHWFTRTVADVITAIMWLLVYRPMQRRPNTIHLPQITHPGILRLSVDVLERIHQLQTNPAASQFRWLSQTYVQWHALAVTIAELCFDTDGPMVERAWAIVEPAFEQMAQHVADSDRGMLWRPIKKLMNRARGVRQAHLDSRSTTSPSVAVLNTTDQMNPSIRTAHSNAKINDYTEWPMKSMPLPNFETQQAKPIANSEPFDWDPWLTAATAATSTLTQSQYNPYMDDVALTNWEDFIDDFQGQGDAVLGLSA